MIETVRPTADCFNEHGIRKKAWPTEGEAFAAAQEISRHNLDGRVGAYRCPDCLWYHVGHSKRYPKEGLVASQKGTIIKLLAQREATDPVDLADQVSRAGIPTNPRSIAVAVWDLQKQDLVEFEERNRIPVHIKLTRKGERIADGSAQMREDDKVATAAKTKTETIADQIERLMLQAGQNKVWSPIEIAEAIGLEVKHPGSTVSVVLGESRKFARVDRGQWTLSIWKQASDSQPVIAVAQAARNGAEPAHQNEKPAPVVETNGVDLLAGLPHIVEAVERAQKVDQMAEAARILEASGEGDLALQVLSKIELGVLEKEVVELVRRIRGEATHA